METKKMMSGSAVSPKRLMLNTFFTTLVFSVILYNLDGDPDPMDGGTVIFYGIYAVVSLGLSFIGYKLKLRTFLTTYPHVLSSIIAMIVIICAAFLLLGKNGG